MTEWFPWLIAQNMAEYGGMAGAISTAWSSLQLTVSDQFHNMGTGSWTIVGIAVIGLLLLWSRRR